ncbi:NADP-dependent oxidoreductase [Kibdelosporangium phytohabitans]|uniref:NADP-dependent oxidoreductase n=1 Tax=Kibdelosporangium phytohabitans TaxID=860235 RepID=A0A0N9ICE1_9PSEU|nr:NADP-dependent oxidoreductase [Kibdelosporangium phytohabitans]ALG14052.1 NADP-dependent oxidoreductase [Kibdelosporangium phytohabitans]MBE1466983.1 NADPH-dependent curcumin reductase CurA [Kibdelosporangium phytohabitans]
MIAREIRLAARPTGMPKPSDFEIAEVEVPSPGEGQILVRNKVLSVDPYMRGRMSDAPNYAESYRVGEVMWGRAIGEVVESSVDSLRPGDFVMHGLGWREYATPEADEVRKVDPEVAPLSAYLGVLGMTGLTAYAGMVDIAGIKEGDHVFVSGAAGAVGSVAGQIAKLRGAARVVGSAGSAEKVRYLKEELGLDEAFNYKDGPVAAQLQTAAPDGVDVYFDNVGGDHLEAAIGAMNMNGRAALCGWISQYNATSPPVGPNNMGRIVGWRLRLQGFIVTDHNDRMPEFLAEAGEWVRTGRLKYAETIVEGFEHTPDAFMDMLAGKNTGKMVVSL